MAEADGLRVEVFKGSRRKFRARKEPLVGLFITFEGIEGCGKTTQAEMLKDYLIGRRLEVVLTREPGGTDLGERIRKILLSMEGDSLTLEAELLLYLACRAQIVDDVIKPGLEKDKMVICDRFSDSTIAYQGYGKGLPLDKIGGFNSWVTGGLKPDITFLLDCPVEVGLKRAWGRIRAGEAGEDRFEREDIEFHKRVREGYLEIASSEDRVRVISADRDPSLIHRDICDIIDCYLKGY